MTSIRNNEDWKKSHYLFLKLKKVDKSRSFSNYPNVLHTLSPCNLELIWPSSNCLNTCATIFSCWEDMFRCQQSWVASYFLCEIIMDENSNLDKINGLLKGMLVDLVDEQSRSRKLSENWNQLGALKQGSRNWPNPVFVELKNWRLN